MAISVDDISVEAAASPASTHRGDGPAEGTTPDSGGTRNLITVTVVLLLLALIGYFTLPMVLQGNVVTPATTTQPTAD
jgi:hypothetical protein